MKSLAITTGKDHQEGDADIKKEQATSLPHEKLQFLTPLGMPFYLYKRSPHRCPLKQRIIYKEYYIGTTTNLII